MKKNQMLMKKKESELNQKMVEKEEMLKLLNLEFDKRTNEIKIIQFRFNQSQTQLTRNAKQVNQHGIDIQSLKKNDEKLKQKVKEMNERYQSMVEEMEINKQVDQRMKNILRQEIYCDIVENMMNELREEQENERKQANEMKQQERVAHQEEMKQMGNGLISRIEELEKRISEQENGKQIDQMKKDIDGLKKNVELCQVLFCIY